MRAVEVKHSSAKTAPKEDLLRLSLCGLSHGQPLWMGQRPLPDEPKGRGEGEPQVPHRSYLGKPSWIAKAKEQSLAEAVKRDVQIRMSMPYSLRPSAPLKPAPSKVAVSLPSAQNPLPKDPPKLVRSSAAPSKSLESKEVKRS